jgi:hypothetical protein
MRLRRLLLRYIQTACRLTGGHTYECLIDPISRYQRAHVHECVFCKHVSFQRIETFVPVMIQPDEEEPVWVN